MFKKISKLVFTIIFINLLVTGCGTKFMCAPEFQRSIDKEFWCSPLGSIGDFFKVQPPLKKPPSPKINCKDTIADKECESL